MKNDKETYIERKYREFYEKNGYIPKYFDLYNAFEINDYAPTLFTRSNGAMGCGTVLIVVDKNK